MMNPTGDPQTMTHPLARMLPKGRYQSQTYRLAESSPPGLENGFCPYWGVVPFTLGALQTQQARLPVQTDFHLMALSGNTGADGGFRYQLYDTKKKLKLTDRGVSFNTLGVGGRPIYLREPYPMCEPDAQVLVIIQNQDTSHANDGQIVLYGQVRRFNFPA